MGIKLTSNFIKNFWGSQKWSLKCAGFVFGTKWPQMERKLGKKLMLRLFPFRGGSITNWKSVGVFSLEKSNLSGFPLGSLTSNFLGCPPFTPRGMDEKGGVRGLAQNLLFLVAF